MCHAVAAQHILRSGITRLHTHVLATLGAYVRDACVQLRERVDVMVSHDWPTSIARYGNCAQLLRAKPFFQQEVEEDCLGSPANWQLLQARPS